MYLENLRRYVKECNDAGFKARATMWEGLIHIAENDIDFFWNAPKAERHADGSISAQIVSNDVGFYCAMGEWFCSCYGYWFDEETGGIKETEHQIIRIQDERDVAVLESFCEDYLLF